MFAISRSTAKYTIHYLVISGWSSENRRDIQVSMTLENHIVHPPTDPKGLILVFNNFI